MEINSYNQSEALLLLLLRSKTPLRQGELCLLKGQTIISENYTMIESLFWAIKSCQICFTNHHWSHVNLIPYNNQILEIENVDDVDDLTIFCLITIMIVIGC